MSIEDVIPLGARLPSHADTARDVLVREQLAAVRAVWPSLTEKERDVLAGVLNGRTYRQLAAELDCTLKSVDGALRRARRKLAAEEVLVA